MMVDFIDQKRSVWGVESICSQLPIAPSTYYHHKACEIDSTKLSNRKQQDIIFETDIQRVYKENHELYGAKKMWAQLKKEGTKIARCTVERIMRYLGLKGVVRGKTPQTTISSYKDERPLDLVNRNFRADRPNQLWVADFTYVATWIGFVYVAFVIDAFSRMIVGWKVSKTMTGDLTLDALEQAIWSRKVKEPLIHHSDRGSQYLSIRYSERLKAEGISSSVGSVGDAYDNALAETINGLYKTEVIRRRRYWKNLEEVEFATLGWVHWFNNKRIFGPIGNMPPVEFEKIYYDSQEVPALVAGLT